MGRDVWIITRKDLRLFFRDKTALLLTLALPILLATIFGSAMGAMSGGGGEAPAKVNLQVEDQDGTDASRALVAKLQASNGLSITVAEDAESAVRGGDMPAAIVIPAGYGETLAGGEVPPLRLLRDPSRQIAQQVIAGNLMPVLFESVVEEVGPNLMGTVLDGLEFPEAGRGEAQAALEGSWAAMDEVIAQMMAEGEFEAGSDEEEEEGEGGGFDFMNDIPAMLGVVTEDVAGRKDDDGFSASAGASHAIAAMAVMMLMFSLVGAGGTLLEEQQEGTLTRLQLAPSAGTAILLSKLASMGLIGLLQLFVLFVYGALMFDVPVLAAPFQLALISIGVVLAATGLGLVFATMCSSRKQLEGVSTLVILVMSAVGGAWFPREITPEWFRFAGQFTITAYAMDAYHGVLWYGKGLFASDDLGGIWRDVAMLYGIAIALLFVAFRAYHRRFGALG